MRIRYSIPALKELASILDHIRKQAPAGAQKVLARLKVVETYIAAFPGVGRMTDKPNVRMIVAHPYPYAVYYEARANEILIHDVRHTSRSARS